MNIDEVKLVAEDVDIIVDCSDNFETRYALNKIAFDLKRPLISGAAIKFDGQVSIFDFRNNNSGFTLGAGAEYAVAFRNKNANSVSVKLQTFYYF